MRGFWRGLAIFFLGGILGTGFGVAARFFFFPLRLPAAAGDGAIDRRRPSQSGRTRPGKPAPPSRPRPPPTAASPTPSTRRAGARSARTFVAPVATGNLHSPPSERFGALGPGPGERSTNVRIPGARFRGRPDRLSRLSRAQGRHPVSADFKGTMFRRSRRFCALSRAASAMRSRPGRRISKYSSVIICASGSRC